jgi:hypothetical protein
MEPGTGGNWTAADTFRSLTDEAKGLQTPVSYPPGLLASHGV